MANPHKFAGHLNFW